MAGRSTQTVAAAVLLAALAAPVAHADVEARLDAMRGIAAAAFPDVAGVCREVTVTTGPLADPSAHSAEAWKPCEVRLRDEWPRWSRSYLCVMLVHEYGHLAGLDHTHDTASVMYQSPLTTSHPECARLARLEVRHDELAGALSVTRAGVRHYRGALARTSARPHRRRLRRWINQDRASIGELRGRLAQVRLTLGP